MKKKICLLLAVVFTLAALSACTKEKKIAEPDLATCRDYAQAMLDANFKNETALYIELTGDSQEAADALYAATEDYWYNVVKLSLSIAENDEEAIAYTTEVTQKLLAKIDYTVGDATRESEELFIIPVTVRPFDYFTRIDAAVEAYREEFKKRDEAGEFMSLTTEQYDEEYKNGYRELLMNLIDEAEYLEPVEYEVGLEFIGSQISVRRGDTSGVEDLFFTFPE